MYQKSLWGVLLVVGIALPVQAQNHAPNPYVADSSWAARPPS